ncbi:hypothetical protein EYF80_006849 [Liparis tanakae]|uniref:Uncharacterized protein n=1 Tax=Liparis tanakae TaxID=230148 RepID=A0A4Z2J022_9TELE|nr:hypothetical protein EYF80_006849 [Liparis tanakae]
MRSELMEPFCWRPFRLFQPNMGVSPTMKATVQHITTASPARRGVTTRLYLQTTQSHTTSQNAFQQPPHQSYRYMQHYLEANVSIREGNSTKLKVPGLERNGHGLDVPSHWNQTGDRNTLTKGQLMLLLKSPGGPHPDEHQLCLTRGAW